jgi:hypothetical protein
MFIYVLATVFYVPAIIAAFKMETPLKGLLFMLVIAGVSGLLYLFINFPGTSGISVALMLGAFILKQGRR